MIITTSKGVFRGEGFVKLHRGRHFILRLHDVYAGPITIQLSSMESACLSADLARRVTDGSASREIGQAIGPFLGVRT